MFGPNANAVVDKLNFLYLKCFVTTKNEAFKDFMSVPIRHSSSVSLVHSKTHSTSVSFTERLC